MAVSIILQATTLQLPGFEPPFVVVVLSSMVVFLCIPVVVVVVIVIIVNCMCQLLQSDEPLAQPTHPPGSPRMQIPAAAARRKTGDQQTGKQRKFGSSSASRIRH